ncbi:MAG: guanylate kinase [Clostridia bacterium]|nr:guanylate kinase [Clostridia bacterium]
MGEVRKGMLLVVSGPSGVGKGTVSRPLDEDASFIYSVSCTTRAPRPGEADGREYYFITEDRFREMIDAGEFLEYALVHGNFYGTPRKPVLEALERGQNIRLEIDTQGAEQVMGRMPDCVSVFILPPSYSELRRRLEGRGTETQEVVERRLANARQEIADCGRYQYLIVNVEVEEATRALLSIVQAEKQRASRYYPTVEE